MGVEYLQHHEDTFQATILQLYVIYEDQDGSTKITEGVAVITKLSYILL